MDNSHYQQETVEEVAKLHAGIPIDRVIDEEERYYASGINEYDSFIAGAEWQAKRMYSEEEVLRLITCCKEYLSFLDEFNEKEWFEQFKKK